MVAKVLLLGQFDLGDESFKFNFFKLLRYHFKFFPNFKTFDKI